MVKLLGKARLNDEAGNFNIIIDIAKAVDDLLQVLGCISFKYSLYICDRLINVSHKLAIVLHFILQ